MMRVQNHHQFQKTMTFCLVSKLERHQPDEELVFGFADDNDMDDQEELRQAQIE